MGTRALRRAIEAELDGNLLPFWRRRCLDEANGGFIGQMADDGTVSIDAPKGLILTTRLLWTFSELFAEHRQEEDLALAYRAWEYLEDKLRDSRHGGYLWRVDASGRPLEGAKKIYGQAFAVYALSAYALATGDSAAAESARELFELIEAHAHDDECGGYVEARAEDWSATSELQLSGKDMTAAKSMNTHLHLLEAYTGLYRLWPEERVDRRLRELIDLFGRRILDGDTWHLHNFFDETWTVLSDTYTYGHDIEAAWLLCEAADVLGDSEARRGVQEWAVEIARTVVEQAIDHDGGLAYEGRAGVVIDPNREWWCQAEAVVGFWQAYELTGDEVFRRAVTGVWNFIERFVVDRENGEWFWRVLPDGTIDRREPKVSEWKGPYHNVRMCLEILRRLDRAAEGER